MIPVEAGRFVGGNAEAIFKGPRAGLDHSAENVVFVAGRRNGQAVEMKVGGEGSHGHPVARGLHRHGRGVRRRVYGGAGGKLHAGLPC